MLDPFTVGIIAQFGNAADAIGYGYRAAGLAGNTDRVRYYRGLPAIPEKGATAAAGCRAGPRAAHLDVIDLLLAIADIAGGCLHDIAVEVLLRLIDVRGGFCFRLIVRGVALIH